MDTYGYNGHKAWYCAEICYLAVLSMAIGPMVRQVKIRYSPTSSGTLWKLLVSLHVATRPEPLLNPGCSPAFSQVCRFHAVRPSRMSNYAATRPFSGIQNVSICTYPLAGSSRETCWGKLCAYAPRVVTP
jgi:hypothetical protein